MIRFLTALHNAERLRPHINDIGFDNEVEVPLAVFLRCKAHYLAMGKPSAAWITPAGKRLIGLE